MFTWARLGSSELLSVLGCSRECVGLEEVNSQHSTSGIRACVGAIGLKGLSVLVAS